MRKERLKFREHQSEEVSAEDMAKKTLLDVGHQDKEHKLNHLKEYLRNKHNSRIENVLPRSNMDIKLPMIRRPGYSLGYDSARKYLENSSSAVMVNKIKIENEEE